MGLSGLNVLSGRGRVKRFFFIFIFFKIIFYINIFLIAFWPLGEPPPGSRAAGRPTAPPPGGGYLPPGRGAAGPSRRLNLDRQCGIRCGFKYFG